MAQKADKFYDRYGILTPREAVFIDCPRLTECSKQPRAIKFWQGDVISVDGKNDVFNLMHYTPGMMTTKMLAVYADGNEHHCTEVYEKLGMKFGHDIDCWRGLEKKNLIKHSSTQKYGRKLYRITPLGKEVLDIADANGIYYRVARWFKIKGSDAYSAMMKNDLEGGCAWNDISPESMTALLEQLFNPSSRQRKIGSAYRWMNNFMYLLRTSSEFFAIATSPEAASWIDSHMSVYPELQNYIKQLAKVKKHWMKKAVA